ncbi:DUF445 family protein [Desulfurispirillum indicum]|nr:DUF445 family protein [Desulfurispirillum indicum]UCZ58008.1 DUF445 family protein [Desulfurispirillum indicum]
MPFIGLFIGWGTNMLAIRMLFRPHRPVYFLGLNFQGILPKRRGEIARKIAGTVQDELLSVEEITRIFHGFDIRTQIEAAVDELIREKLRNKITEKIPMMASVIDSLIPKIRPVVVEDFYAQAMKLKQDMVDKIHREVDIGKIVEEKLDQFDLDEFEAMILRLAKKELRHIELLGAVLGFIIGLIQSVIIIYL